MKHFETALNKIKKKSGNRIVDSPNLHGDDAITDFFFFFFFFTNRIS